MFDDTIIPDQPELVPRPADIPDDPYSIEANGHATLQVMEGGRPVVVLPGNTQPVSQSSARLGELLDRTRRYFCRDGTPVRVEQQDEERILRPVKPAELPDAFERIATLKAVRLIQGRPLVDPATCTEATAKLILHAESFKERLSPIRVMCPCPVLAEYNGELIQVHDYNRDLGILAAGDKVPLIGLDEAVRRLNELLADFNFATPSDRSRAIAVFLTPALVFGGLLRGRAPVGLIEANESQSGKGFLNKLVASVYSQEVRTITQKTGGGVGSLEETLASKLVAGANFISIDNVRGKIDSPFFESVLTEDRASCRVPYLGNVDVDPRRTIFMMTSNRAEITEDLANRSSCVRILKRSPEYEYQSFDGHDILDHLKADAARYLAAAFAFTHEWHRLGKLRTNENRHPFRFWAQTLDYIVQYILNEAPLIDGHQETKQRMTNPDLNWLRDVAITVMKDGKLGFTLQANELIRIADAAGIDVPGVGEADSIDDDEVFNKACKMTGKKLAKCFTGGDDLSIDGITIERTEDVDENYHRLKTYRFSTSDTPASNTGNPPSPAVPANDPIQGISDAGKYLVRDALAGTAGDGGNGDSDGGESWLDH